MSGGASAWTGAAYSARLAFGTRPLGASTTEMLHERHADASPIINHQDRGMTAMQHEPTLGLQLGETAGAHKV